MNDAERKARVAALRLHTALGVRASRVRTLPDSRIVVELTADQADRFATLIFKAKRIGDPDE